MCPDAPHFIILLCIKPDNFAGQGESAPLNELIRLSAHAPC
jgi:hypothetical protein